MAAVRHHDRAPFKPDPVALADAAYTSPWQPTHRQLEALVDEVAHRLGWRIQATHDSRGEAWSADSGWPDRFLVRALTPLERPVHAGMARALALEIKVPPDSVTEEQFTWLTLLEAVPGIEAGIFRSCGDRARDMAVLSELLR